MMLTTFQISNNYYQTKDYKLNSVSLADIPFEEKGGRKGVTLHFSAHYYSFKGIPSRGAFACNVLIQCSQHCTCARHLLNNYYIYFYTKSNVKLLHYRRYITINLD